jgi:hypothetical protein
LYTVLDEIELADTELVGNERRSIILGNVYDDRVAFED